MARVRPGLLWGLFAAGALYVFSRTQAGQSAIQSATEAIMSLSPTGLDAIKKYEAFRAKAYQDSVGKWTIGYGHLIVPGDGYGPDSTISKADALQLLATDTQAAQSAVNESVAVPINSNQFDALTSLAFNIGRHAFANSSVVRALNAGDYNGAADAFLEYVNGHDAEGNLIENIPGLITRRQSEQDTFLS